MDIVRLIHKIVDEKFKQLRLDVNKSTSVNVSSDAWETSQKVKTLNTLSGDVTLSAGVNISLTPAGNNIEVSSTFTQSEILTNGDEADPQIIFYDGDVVMTEV